MVNQAGPTTGRIRRSAQTRRSRHMSRATQARRTTQRLAAVLLPAITVALSFPSAGASAAPVRDHGHTQISHGRLNGAGKSRPHHVQVTPVTSPVTAPATTPLRSGHAQRVARAARRADAHSAKRDKTKTAKGTSTAKRPSTAKTGRTPAAFTCQLRINRVTAYDYVKNYSASQTLHLYSTVLAGDKKALTQLAEKDDPLGRVRTDVRKLEHHIRRFKGKMAARSLALHDFQTAVCSMTPGQRASQWTQIHAQSSKIHAARGSLHHIARTLEAAIARADHHL